MEKITLAELQRLGDGRRKLRERIVAGKANT